MKQLLKLSASTLLLCNSAYAINMKEKSQLSSGITGGRYINSAGKAINLAQSTGHLKLDLKSTDQTVESVTEQALSQEGTEESKNAKGGRARLHPIARNGYYKTEI